MGCFILLMSFKVSAPNVQETEDLIIASYLSHGTKVEKGISIKNCNFLICYN